MTTKALTLLPKGCGWSQQLDHFKLTTQAYIKKILKNNFTDKSIFMFLLALTFCILMQIFNCMQ